MHEGCTGGGYDLAPVVAGLARSRKRSVKGRIFCHGTNGAIGHGSIDYEVNIRYGRQGHEQPQGDSMAGQRPGNDVGSAARS